MMKANEIESRRLYSSSFSSLPGFNHDSPVLGSTNSIFKRPLWLWCIATVTVAFVVLNNTIADFHSVFSSSSADPDEISQIRFLKRGGGGGGGGGSRGGGRRGGSRGGSKGGSTNQNRNNNGGSTSNSAPYYGGYAGSRNRQGNNNNDSDGSGGDDVWFIILIVFVVLLVLAIGLRFYYVHYYKKQSSNHELSSAYKAQPSPTHNADHEENEIDMVIDPENPIIKNDPPASTTSTTASDTESAPVTAVPVSSPSTPPSVTDTEDPANITIFSPDGATATTTTVSESDEPIPIAVVDGQVVQQSSAEDGDSPAAPTPKVNDRQEEEDSSMVNVPSSSKFEVTEPLCEDSNTKKDSSSMNDS